MHFIFVFNWQWICRLELFHRTGRLSVTHFWCHPSAVQILCFVTSHNHIVFYHSNVFVWGQQQLLSWTYGRVYVSVTVRNMTSARSCWLLVTAAAADITLRLSLAACVFAHVSVRVGLCVCMWPQMHQHVCTLISVRDNVLLCAEGAGGKPNSQGHSSSAAAVPSLHLLCDRQRKW